MLIIRDQQLHALGLAAERTFMSRAEEHLRRAAPEVCAALGPEGLRSLVQAAMDKTLLYGLRRDYDVLRFLNLMVLFGPDFDTEQAWAQELLRHPDLEAGTRMDLLDQRADIELAEREEQQA